MVDRVNAPFKDDGKSGEEMSEHDKKMAEVADKGATQLSDKDGRDGQEDQTTLTQQETADENEDGVRQRPDDIPEQFWDAEKGEVNVEALLKSQRDGQAELNRLRGEKKSEQSDEESGEESGEESASENQTNVVADASAEWAEKGELSDETYKKLEGVGLGREYVDAYISGQKAVVAQLESAAFGEFDGTREGYEKATAWAAENLTDAEIDALDAQLTSNNPAIVREGAKALAAKYSANADIDPSTTVTGQGNTSVSGDYFKSGAEMQTAMADPRYARDPAFRDEVAAKIARAEKAGVNLFG